MVNEVLSPYREAVDAVIEAGGEALRQCYQCGLCTGTCPWNYLKKFSSRSLIHQAQLGTADFESEETWTCVTCRACVARCPREVAIIDIMKALRSIIAEMGAGYMPESLRVTLKNIAGAGNPLGEPAENRHQWAGDRKYPEQSELLYVPCCVSAYDPVARRIAQATAAVLDQVGVPFGVANEPERCCGESVRKAGNESLFAALAQHNIETFSRQGAGRLLTSSPHCYHTFLNEYPDLGGRFDVLHYTQYLAGLLREGKLKFGKELNIKVTYHDPCYLGRHNGVYDDPRELLRGIPGIELVEMDDYGPDSICCGGGGGRIWQENVKGERLSDLRLDQALATGADVLAVACPYCLLNFEDGVLTTSASIQVKDITEIVREAL